MDNKKIIVFWDDNGFNAEIEKNKTFKVCCNQSEFNALDEKTLREAQGFLVLCELSWNHESAQIPRVEFGGIRLVQHFIRKKLGLRTPVVFSSICTQNQILNQFNLPDTGIIATPALNHFFVQLPCNPDGFLKAFQGKKPMNNDELVYTQMLYCDSKGTLYRIKHAIGKGSEEDNEELRHQIEMVINKDFGNDKILIEKLNATNNLGDFCQELIDKIESPLPPTLSDTFICEKADDQIELLILEDNANDKNVKNFIKYIHKANVELEKRDPFFLFREPKLVLNLDEFRKKFKKEYNRLVVICDIEIRNELGELVALGFDVVKECLNTPKSPSPLYYIVSNVSRSVYDQIKVPGIRRIRLKEEAFGSRDRIEAFLYGIKDIMDNRKTWSEQIKDSNVLVFNMLYEHIQKTSVYPTAFSKKTKLGLLGVEKLESYQELENCVRNKSLELIKKFLGLCNSLWMEEDSLSDNYDAVCCDMREYIYPERKKNETLEDKERRKRSIGFGNGKFIGDIMDKVQNDQPLDVNDISNFVIKLIHRRFFLYLTEFLQDEKYQEIVKKSGVLLEDVACQAISSLYKGGVSKEGKEQNQSKCLRETLLFSDNSYEVQLSLEEEAFVDSIKEKGIDAFDFSSEEAIQQLNFD